MLLNILRPTSYLGRYVCRASNSKVYHKILGSTFPGNHFIGNNSTTPQATTAFGISTIILAVEKSQSNETIKTETSKTTETPVTTETPIDMSKYRLPTSAEPISYDLYLYPNIENGLFRGSVYAKTKIRKTTISVVLNSNKLNISNVFIDGEQGLFETDNIFELLSIRKRDGSTFSANSEVDIKINFKGDMKHRIVGLYTSSYKNTAGNSRYIATSKFEPTYARQAFPCFDEPNLKATFNVHLLKPNDPDYTALSNYPETSTENVDEGVLVHFGKTVPMSTYLVCFIVSDFKFTETQFENDGASIPFRVYASPDQLAKTTFAGEIGKKVIEYYIQYFNIPYPLPKLDMVAIPDFVSGAMEHWGLVTFRETALLYDGDTHSASNRQRVAEVVAHELAHSWFGNLVTMDWWNNLWLNEGFATYIEYKGVDIAEPKWQMMDQFLVGTMHSVLSLDATQASHPIIQTVQTPDQITEVFDTISYNKGASVLRMLENVVEASNFQKGVTNYLKKYKYGNAVTQHLWDEIQAVVGNELNITEFMDTFTVQMGYPILDIASNEDKYVLTQKRFLKDYSTNLKGETSPLNYRWSVPVTYITDSGHSSKIHWFSYKSDRLVIDKPANAKWIKFNPGQIGYYRVNYIQNDWQNLIANINDLTDSDKTHLLEESFSIAESGDLSYEIPLELTKYLVNETHYVPWYVASSEFQKLTKYLSNSQYEKEFKNYVISLLSPAYDQLGWDDSDSNEDHLNKLARTVILNLACVLEYDDALNETRTRFNEWISDPSQQISPNLRAIIYKYGMINADEDTWEQLFEIFVSETDANEKLKLMNGLANVRNPSLLSRLIELAKDETYIRSQDYFTLLQYIASNSIGTPIVWDYVRENWPQLVNRFTLNDRYLGRLIPSITNKFTTNIKIEEMQHFFAKYPEAGAGTTARQQALESVSNNIKWLRNYKKIVEDWIVKNALSST